MVRVDGLSGYRNSLVTKDLDSRVIFANFIFLRINELQSRKMTFLSESLVPCFFAYPPFPSSSVDALPLTTLRRRCFMEIAPGFLCSKCRRPWVRAGFKPALTNWFSAPRFGRPDGVAHSMKRGRVLWWEGFFLFTQVGCATWITVFVAGSG